MPCMKPIIENLGAGKFIMIGNTILFMILLISFDFTTFLIILIRVVNFFTARIKIKFVLKNQKINDFNQKMRN